ncbi:MAG: Abi family protein, partial [Malacoplasma sp.]|nr:Abi family protein [Malacoplasma sp.]
MKTYKEIKTTLENLGLNVVDFEKLVQYIDIFPFERFIQDYSGPFVDVNTQRYIKECNSNEIIALIEFDKNLSCLLLKAILFFENKFKKILVENWVSYYNMKSDKIYNFSDQELLSYMPNINNCSDLKFSKFRYSLFEYASNSDFLQSYNSLSDIPIAELSYSWTFATSINFYRVMDDRIQKMILTKLRIKTDYV